ncbi:MAG: thioredoxin family protein [Chitinophagales bacterium]
MINKKIIIALVFIMVGGISLGFVILNNSGSTQVVIEPETSQVPAQFASAPDEGMKWYSIGEALELQKETKKKLFIDVYTNWCGPCKMLANTTLADPVIQKGLTEYYIPVKFNAEGKDTVNFNGVQYVNKKPEYKNGPRGNTHDFTFVIAQTPQGIGYPTMVFLNENLEMLQPFQGVLSAEQLEPIIAFFGSDAYKSKTWEEFMKTFQSQLTSSN